MGTVKSTSNPKPENTEEVPPVEETPADIDQNLLMVLTGPKAKALEILAGMRKEFESAKNKADELKRQHDSLVETARNLRRDFKDVEKIEKRGAPTKDAKATPETPAETPKES